jgi:hypothetical protein
MKTPTTFALVTAALAWAAPAPAQIKLGVEAGDRVVETLEAGKVVKSEPVPGASIVKVTPGGIADGFKLQKDDLIRGVVSEGLGKRRIDSIADLVWVMDHSTRTPSEIYLIRKDAQKREQLLKVGLVQEERVINQQQTSGGGQSKVVAVKVLVNVPKFTPAKDTDLAEFKPAK